MTRTFDRLIGDVKKAIVASQGAGVSLATLASDGRKVSVYAFRAGGNVKPGSFRSTWAIDGVEMSKDAARAALGGK